MSFADTIVARATPSGRGALAIVRVSGAQSEAIWRTCFRPTTTSLSTPSTPSTPFTPSTSSTSSTRSTRSTASTGAALDGAAPHAPPEPRRARHGLWCAPDAPASPIDEVVAIFYRAPASFTGEDAIEIVCHGSDLIAAAIGHACCAAGARPARPGEFSQRAFENGKMDLTQARAVAELIEAETAEARRQALVRLRGGLGDAIRTVESRLLDAAALVEAYIDFPEQEIGAEDANAIAAHLGAADAALTALLATHRRGRLLQQGARVVLAGAPNAGKSSLFNALVGSARAIVSPHPGTTRDTIEARLDLDGLAVTLVDTAGVRADPEHDIERLGIERTRAELATAHAVAWLFDPTVDVSAQVSAARLLADDARRSHAAPGPPATLAIATKRDLVGDGAAAALAGCALDGLTAHAPLATSDTDAADIAAVVAAIRTALGGPHDAAFSAPSSAVLCADESQAHQLAAAHTALARAAAAFRARAGGELVMVDLRDALDSLALLTGTSAHDEMLDRIFRRFCLGK